VEAGVRGARHGAAVPGGVAGDDPDVVRKMRLGTLNAGVLTSVGVAEIEKSVYAMGIPLMYDSYEEVYAVHEKMRPKLEAALEAKGFVASTGRTGAGCTSSRRSRWRCRTTCEG